MCGIIGYSGSGSAQEVLLDGLSSLEYRGYDSAGIALFEAGQIRVIKSQGKVENVRKKVQGLGKINSVCGIGHTRWATHGEPSDINSHPHGSKLVQLVHNGIIENYRELVAELSEDGYRIISDTDTEPCALIIDKYYRRLRDPKKAILRAVCRFKGSFALGIIFKDYPNTVYAVRHESPLIVGSGKDESFIASDITALLPYTKKYYSLPSGVIAELKGGDVSFFDESGAKVTLEQKEATWDALEAKRQGYSHFMLKEIHEQTEAIKRTLSPRIKDGMPCFEHDGVDFDKIARSKRIFLVGCGTAYHACLIGKSYIEKYARVPVTVEIASEMRYGELSPSSDDTVIAVSQSGETADTLSALKKANEAGAYTLSIVNVLASSIALEAEATIYTMAGPEIAVASTKAYVIQSCVLCLFALAFASHLGKISDEELKKTTSALLSELPEAISKIISEKDKIALIARRVHTRSSLFFIGRGVDYYSVLEASLKLKEISYIHSEAYPAGELKHGTISLIEQGVPVVALSCVSRLKEKLQSNIKEVASRGALVIRVESSEIATHDTDFTLPPLCEELLPLACASFFQLFAYYCALERNCDIDHPRNLAKSVTVE